MRPTAWQQQKAFAPVRRVAGLRHCADKAHAPMFKRALAAVEQEEPGQSKRA